MPSTETDKEQFALIRELEKKVAALEAKQNMMLAMFGGLGLALATDILSRVLGA